MRGNECPNGEQHGPNIALFAELTPCGLSYPLNNMHKSHQTFYTENFADCFKEIYLVTDQLSAHDQQFFF